uniref:Uncharacterized protein n=1 Tax=Solanum lycopersicum TaxID=4081 RepID=A0A3Q7H5C3_SOLLC
MDIPESVSYPTSSPQAHAHPDITSPDTETSSPIIPNKKRKTKSGEAKPYHRRPARGRKIVAFVQKKRKTKSGEAKPYHRRPARGRKIVAFVQVIVFWDFVNDCQ